MSGPRLKRTFFFPSFSDFDAVLAAQGLADGEGRFGDLLEKEMGVVAAVDIPRRDLGLLDHRLPPARSGCSVVVECPLMPASPPAGVLIEDEDLAGRLGVVRAGWLLAVHLDESGTFLPPGRRAPRRRDTGRAQAHIDRLAAALQGEEDLARFQVAHHGDGVGPFEIADGAAGRPPSDRVLPEDTSRSAGG